VSYSSPLVCLAIVELVVGSWLPPRRSFPPVVFFAGRLGGQVFVLPLIPQVVTHLQRIDTMGSVGLAGRVEWG
jgi:hypothetical protein